jgi:hypothetical protein
MSFFCHKCRYLFNLDSLPAASTVDTSCAADEGDGGRGLVAAPEGRGALR